LVVLSAGHLFGLDITRAGLDQPVLTASAPVTVDWDFATGKLVIVGREPATVTLAGRAQPLVLAAGRHEVTLPGPDLTQALNERLAGARRQVLHKGPPFAFPGPEELPIAWTAELGGAPAAMAPAGELLAVASGKTVHLLDGRGQVVRRLACDGPVRVLHWWPEPKLLVAGCTDEQVIAFDLTGQRRWTFTSVMDPAVFRAGKQYWFKSAPGHEGIHGLGSGPFIDGRPQLVVGSACTLEIVEADGRLAKRLPVFWGPGTLFRLLDAPDGSRNLLLGRWPGDSHALAVINSRTLDPEPRSFSGVPPGFDYVGGWMVQNRNHLFITDLTGDGAPEVVSEVNGTWNRVTVWAADGTPLACANFGPGPAAPARTVRGLELLDLDGDGKREIVAALADGLVIALNAQCRKRWSTRLASPPVTLTGLPGAAPALVVGCEDGSVVSLDGSGQPTRTVKLPRRPKLAGRFGAAGVVVTEAGQVMRLYSN
jgi:hypothetical protein